MKQIEKIDSLHKLNSLSDPRRIEILQLLMEQPRTISQVSRILDEYPAGSRYHMKVLEEAGLVEMHEVRVSDGYTEKYYRAIAKAFILNKIIFPSQRKSTLVIMGSHDLALEQLITLFETQFPENSIINLPVGSMDGLIALRQGFTPLSGCHILDQETRKFNTPLIKRFFPEGTIKVFTLAHREQGLLFPPGNPKQIRGFEDLARGDLTIINRNQGSGTRLWLDKFIKDYEISPFHISGYTQEVNSHTAVANAIKRGLADTGLGLIAAAVIEGLDYTPLFIEQYDLAIHMDRVDQDILNRLMDILNSAKFRRSISSLAGYDATKTGLRLN